MDRHDLMRKMLASVAGVADIYTDANDCASSVAAAYTLSVSPLRGPT